MQVEDIVFAPFARVAQGSNIAGKKGRCERFHESGLESVSSAEIMWAIRSGCRCLRGAGVSACSTGLHLHVPLSAFRCPLSSFPFSRKFYSAAAFLLTHDPIFLACSRPPTK